MWPWRPSAARRGVSRRAARARPVSRRGHPRRLRARRAAALSSRPGRPATVDVTLSSVALHRGGRRDRAARRGSRAGSADSGVGVSGELVDERRRLQRQPPEGADPDRPVLLDQSAQLGDQHPRPRRAVRADQRRHRAGRRPLHRRRLLRAARRGDARLPRRRADRSAARPAGHALRQEHHRRRDQRHDAQARPSRRETDVELNYGNFGFVQAKASVSGPLRRSVAGRLSFSGTQRDGFVDNVEHAGRRERSQQSRRPRPDAVRAVRHASRSRWPSDHTRQRPEGYTQVVAGVAPTLRPAEPAVRRRSPPTSATRRRASTPSIALTDVDTPLRSYQDLGGASLNDRLEARAGPADVDHRLALLELGSLERPRLHRPAGHDDLGRARRSSGSGRRRSATPATLSPTLELRRRRVRVPAGARLRSVVQAGAGLGRRALPAGADAPPRRRPACSTATASTST